MSSIYRKGRDGYFYYQTYVYSEKTGKKDKKIFHATGTKDRSLAKKKQKEFDKKYKSNRNNLNQKLKEKRGIKGLLIPISGLILAYLSGLYTEKLLFKNEVESSENYKKYFTRELSSDTSLLTSHKVVKDSSSLIQIKKPKDYSGSDNKEQTIISPQYVIRRVESFNNLFNQGKIYVTVDSNYNQIGLKTLCRKIKEDYKKFRNIIICLYDNSDSGILLSEGIKQKADSNQEIKSWLVMYSYNEVEGEYFDNNPSKYLNPNK